MESDGGVAGDFTNSNSSQIRQTVEKAKTKPNLNFTKPQRPRNW